MVLTEQHTSIGKVGISEEGYTYIRFHDSVSIGKKESEELINLVSKLNDYKADTKLLVVAGNDDEYSFHAQKSFAMAKNVRRVSIVACSESSQVVHKMLLKVFSSFRHSFSVRLSTNEKDAIDWLMK